MSTLSFKLTSEIEQNPVDILLSIHNFRGFVICVHIFIICEQ